MSFHSWNMAEGLYRCAQVCTGVHRWVQVCTGVYRWVQVCRGVSVTGWRRCVLPVDEHVLLHVAGRVSQTLTGQGLVLVPVIPQHNTQTEKQWGEPAVNSHHQNRTEQNSPTTMWPGFYMWFLSEWFLNLHLSGEVSLTVTLSFSGVKQLSLFFSCVQSCTLWCCWIQIKTSIADMEPGVCRHLKRLVLTFVFAVRYHHKPRDLQLVPGPLVMIKMYLCFLSTHHVI